MACVERVRVRRHHVDTLVPRRECGHWPEPRARTASARLDERGRHDLMRTSRMRFDTPREEVEERIARFWRAGTAARPLLRRPRPAGRGRTGTVQHAARRTYPVTFLFILVIIHKMLVHCCERYQRPETKPGGCSGSSPAAIHGRPKEEAELPLSSPGAHRRTGSSNQISQC
jgi:hypothetical protein